MKTKLGESRPRRLCSGTLTPFLRFGLGLVAGCLAATRLFAADAAPDARLIQQSGVVKYKQRDRVEDDASTNQPLFIGDRLRTLENSRATVLLREQNSIKLGEKSTLDISPAPGKTGLWLSLLRGSLYFFSREKPREIQIRTPHATGAHRGTEFLVIVNDERTLLAVYDGSATLTNEAGGVELQKGQLGEARVGQRPVKVTLEAENIVQWWLYYPGVLDVDELDFTASETNNLAASLNAYRTGDLSAALTTYPGYPSPPEPTTDSGRVYLAGLLLAVGQVAKAEALLDKIVVKSSVAAALRWVIAAVQGKVDKVPQVHTSASEWLGLSYYFQARHELAQALDVARQAVAVSTNFAFGWERVAELEFSFGRVHAAEKALDRSLKLAPRNAQAHALKGFLLSAENRLKEAQKEFEEAIRLDSSLGHAWLGRGLVRFRKGDASGGRMDLQTAAILEPNRSLLRSYLGKAFSDNGETEMAALEFKRASELDPKDPTPWLYSALLNREEYRINESVRDLERSIELNDNRAVYRSQLLLDQDRAVRNASLAKVYRDTGMDDVSLREAARGVSYDYANHSAHQFLAESFDALRDPTRFNLRYETVWFNELLLANLLSPVGAGLLSQNISQQEYSRLFEANRFGLLTSIEFRSDGQIREIISQSGTFGGASYSLDLDYQQNDGVRPNNDLERIEWYTQFKQQLSPRDSIFILTKYQDYESGDNFQHYDPAFASRTLRVEEKQAPIVLAAWHRAWRPGNHTTLLAGWLEDRFEARDAALVLDLRTNVDGTLHSVVGRDFDKTHFANDYSAYSAEANQVVQMERTTLIAGVRVQTGHFETATRLDQPGAPPSFTNRFSPPVDTSLDESFERATLYTYLTRELWSGFELTAGAAYDHLHYPDGFRSSPVSTGVRTRDSVLPKAALVWDALPAMTVRGIYAQSFGGVTFDDSVRLEPTQLAGFGQAYRTVISEAEAGSVIAPKIEVGGVAADVKVAQNTFAGVQAQWLRSRVEQSLGVFEGLVSPPASPSSTPERLDYRERSLALSLHQLIGNAWSAGVSYQLIDSTLDWSYPSIPPGTPVFLLPGGGTNVSRSESAVLHQVGARLGFNHPSGFFARVDSRWFFQDNDGYPNAFNAARPGESLHQLDLYAGFRFARRRGELLLGCLNVTDQDYRLNSLTPYSDLPRERVWLGRVRINF